MFCAFDGDALILRLYGQAKVYHPRDAEWQELVTAFPDIAGSRQIFDLTIDLVQTSCGTGVLFMEHQRPRADTELVPFYAEIGDKGVEEYWRRKNVMSIDGKPTGVVEG
jgi:hypothetical protein